MAAQTQLELLKRGMEAWNAWRAQHSGLYPDLYRADLKGNNLSNANLSDAQLRASDLSHANLSDANLNHADLRGANLSDANLSHADCSDADLSDVDLRGTNLWRTKLTGADLSGSNLPKADLSGADLSEADLSEAKLSGSNLTRADLSGADLSGSNLSRANLSGANLSGANLSGANLNEANLSGANLSGADLPRTNLWRANLTGADLSNASVGGTIFGEIDLSAVKGLDTLWHRGPSTIGIDTILRSAEAISEVFLRGAGVSDAFIEYVRFLANKPVASFLCFISYARKDQEFAERLHADLQSKGVRCWLVPHDILPGDLIRNDIDKAIRLYDKWLLILSEHSIESTWVRPEVEVALENEAQRERPVLIPLRLDERVLISTQSWAVRLRQEHSITDFSKWIDVNEYQKALVQLLNDLQSPQKASHKNQ